MLTDMQLPILWRSTVASSSGSSSPDHLFGRPDPWMLHYVNW